MDAEKGTRGPKGFILLEPGNIMQILPEDNKSWLTLFYSLPEELIAAKVGYQNHSTVSKRIHIISGKFAEYRK